MNVIKKEAAKINQKCKEDKNKLLNDYCNVCLDETKENILSVVLERSVPLEWILVLYILKKLVPIIFFLKL